MEGRARDADARRGRGAKPLFVIIVIVANSPGHSVSLARVTNPSGSPATLLLLFGLRIRHGTLKPAAVHFNKSRYLRKDAACRKASSHRPATAHSPASATTRASTHSGSPGGWKSVRDGGALHTCPRDGGEHADRDVYIVSKYIAAGGAHDRDRGRAEDPAARAQSHRIRWIWFALCVITRDTSST